MLKGISIKTHTQDLGFSPRIVRSYVGIGSPESRDREKPYVVIAMWDTGSEVCCISPELAAGLRLPGAESMRVSGFGADSFARSCKGDIALPDGIMFRNVRFLIDDNISQRGIDVLIGMDVISEMDFALSHRSDGSSILSISFPPGTTVDFSAKN